MLLKQLVLMAVSMYWNGGRKHSTELSMWADVVQDIVLLQPTSAAVERVFSILKSSLGPQQNHTLQDYVPSSLMLQYNKRN